MSNAFADEIEKALAPRFRIERELGEGGMGTVFLVHDATLGRLVALKMLRPELTSMIGRERFLREVNITATLEHPNLLKLLDKGEADEFLFYTMPFVDGPTLRQRLSSGGPMSIDECVDLGGQLADAIGYAHDRGIVHRDIKPENILLSEGRAVLADFGIAQVLTPEQSRQLTSSGITVGTPAYMSPEQVARDRIDGKSDQYSLACVLYEMLAGDPPFASREQRVVLARHALDPVPSLVTIRPTVPPALERVIMRALEKQPADRWPSVGAFAEALRESKSMPVGQLTPRWRQRPLIVAGSAVALAVISFVVWKLTAVRNVPLDDHIIAVLPFQVAGTPSPPMSGDAMASAIRARLEGIGDWRIVPAGDGDRAATVAQARRLARRLRAGTILTGRVQATPAGLAIDAALTGVADGRALARIDRLTVPPDHLLAGLDRAALTLVARASGEPDHRLPGLVDRKPEALKEYLTGVARFQRGRYRESFASFQQALARDSGFAIAGVLGYWAAMAAGERAAGGRGYLLALQNPAALSAADAQVLRADAGPQYPRASSYAERLRVWSRVADSLPRSKDATLRLSQMLREWGMAAGNVEARRQSANLLRGLLASDSSNAPALEGLLDLGAFLGDTAEVRRIADVYFARNPNADRRSYYQWRVAALLRSSNHSRLTRSLLDSATPNALRDVLLQSQLDGADLTDADSAIAELRARARTPGATWDATLLARELAHNAGRVSDAPTWPSPAQFSVPIQPLIQVVQSLYWDGDSIAAARAVAERMPSADGAVPTADATDGRYLDVCTVGLWRAAERDWKRVATAVSRLSRALDVGRSGSLMFIPICRAILNALSASTTSGDGGGELVQLDSMATSAPPTLAYIMFAANITVARLKEARGDIPGALAAVRRRNFARDFGAVGLSTYLREEGRLAALLGDTVGARAAYSKYLALRTKPEPRLEADANRVKSALASLTR
jgi:serine/threonine protein kinase